MSDGPLWKQFIPWGAVTLLLGVGVGGAGLAADPPAPAALAIGWVLTLVGAMVFHAGLVGAAVVDPNGALASGQLSVSRATSDDANYPEGVGGIVAYLRAHPSSPVEDVARAIGSTPGAVYAELDQLSKLGKAHVDGRARWSILD